MNKLRTIINNRRQGIGRPQVAAFALAGSLAFMPILQCGGGGGPTGTFRTTHPEIVVDEGGELITSPSRYRVSGNGLRAGEWVQVYDDNRSPFWRFCIDRIESTRAGGR